MVGHQSQKVSFRPLELKAEAYHRNHWHLPFYDHTRFFFKDGRSALEKFPHPGY